MKSAGPERLRVRIEIPSGSFVKRRSDGSVDFVSPWPCPFNYGAVPSRLGHDGDPLDAVVLGPTLAAGTEAEWPIRGVVYFQDAGCIDDKLVCAAEPLSPVERRRVLRFFAAYSRWKRLLNFLRRAGGPTRLEGWGPTPR